ncbi:hypothetical protein Zmor_018092 [Zophobas morio]|uniref:Uncharacterized protein n=1 Tax=Zophobas morio TaxID=2755281 RepID=A0AA38IAY9_9CUCU|nr:hypothetical protein Zmor_018092 [Zophobas morio]
MFASAINRPFRASVRQRIILITAVITALPNLRVQYGTASCGTRDDTGLKRVLSSLPRGQKAWPTTLCPRAYSTLSPCTNHPNAFPILSPRDAFALSFPLASPGPARLMLISFNGS